MVQIKQLSLIALLTCWKQSKCARVVLARELSWCCISSLAKGSQ